MNLLKLNILALCTLFSSLSVFAQDFDFAAADQTLAAANVRNAATGRTAWDNAVTVDVSLKEFSFTPDVIRLKKGQTTILRLKNDGAAPHYFTAEAFFKSIATRKVQTKFDPAQAKPDAEVKAPYFTAIELYSGRTAEMFIIPMQAGTYKVICTVPGHEAHGMVGTVIVE